MTDPPTDPAAARSRVLAAIARAAAAAGRDPSRIALTAVSKQQTWERVAPLLAAGQRIFGENRVREAIARWEGRREGLELRLIGPLQTNKVGEALGLFDVVETLDRRRLGEAIAREAARRGGAPRLYVQVNTGEEPQKAGVAPAAADALIAACRMEFGLDLEGLMCVPPLGEPAGPHFALLAAIARRNGLTGLSMGMSADFETAVRFGATAVRVGSALFGARRNPSPRAVAD
ncbi:MAG: YggS family pyridoxal phosphate-dependent enzyme [Caulobacteraceae bacterium]